MFHWSQNKENLKELGTNKNTYLEKAIVKMEAYKPAIWIYNANLRRKKKLLNPLGYEKQHLVSENYLQMFYK